MPIFEFLRLSLSERPISNTDKKYPKPEPDVPRQAFLTEVFSKRHDFIYRKNKYTYMPFPIENQQKNILAGLIGKPVEELVNAGPDQFFALTKSKGYKAAFLAIDTAKEQQVIAFVKRNDVGNAQAIISTMLKNYVKDRKGVSWHSDVEYISLKESFWSAVEEHEGEITELSFEFYPPNGLQSNEAFKILKALNKVAKEEINSNANKFSFKNDDGSINAKGDFVKSAAEYASEGAGKIMMKKGNRALFNSRQAKLTKYISKSLMPMDGDKKSKILELLNQLFGKKR